MSDAPRGIVKHSLVVAGHRTSISLEDEFWTELKAMAATRDCALASLVAEIDSQRGGANLSSAIRIAILRDLQARTKDQ